MKIRESIYVDNSYYLYFIGILNFSMKCLLNRAEIWITLTSPDYKLYDFKKILMSKSFQLSLVLFIFMDIGIGQWFGLKVLPSKINYKLLIHSIITELTLSH